MTDGQWLFTVFAALYLLECARWLPGSVYALTGYGKDWQMRRPWAQIQIAGTRLLMLPVLPPMQASLVTAAWPMAPAEEGLELCEGSQIIPWAELAPRIDGAMLVLSPHHSLRLPDEASAKAWRERVLAWQGMNQAAREKDFLKFARQSLDVKALTAQAAKLSTQTRWLRWLALVIFVWTFMVISAIYRWLGESIEVLAAAALLLVLLWTQAVIFFRIAGRTTPPIKHRVWKTLAIACLPQQAMRAADLICRAQIATAHPLAARALIEDAAWLKLARQFWKPLLHGQGRTTALQTQALQTFFQQQSVTPDQLEEVPDRLPGSAAYCPNCFAQFVDANLVCKDCGGLPLKTWPEKA